jgi:3-oxoacyl-[acyl-carrier-protein] synthase-3
MADGGSDGPCCGIGFPEFRHDFDTIRRSGLELLLHCAAAADHAGSESCDYILPHQANGRMDTILAAPLGVARERIVVTADRLGNTGSAAIWLALAQLRPALKPGQTVLALGAEATDFMFGGFRYCHG